MTVSVPGGMTQTNGPLQSRLGRQQQEYFVRRLRTLQLGADAHRASLNSAGAVLAYQAEVRARLETIFGPWPSAPELNGSVEDTLDRTGYVIDKVIFDSLEGWRVSGNLYLPDGASAQDPVPGVVQFCGHDSTGKANATYQAMAQSLALNGIACLVVDCVGQGERKMVPSTPVEEHRLMGQQIPLVGWSLAGLQAWDGKSAISYLLSRDEIDPDYVGVVGNSGGGTQAAWVLANDERVTMGAVSCCAHTFLGNTENELYADAEQTPPRLLELGLDFDDILATFAPKPLLLIGQKLDAIFDDRYLREIHRRCARIWGLLGASDELRLYIGSGSHGLAYDGRQEAVRWFRRAAFDDDDPVTESIPGAETEATLLCTANGTVNDLADARTFTDVMRDWADDCATLRGEPTGDELKARVREVLRLPEHPTLSPPHYRLWQAYYPWTSAEYPKDWAAIYAVETEPGILVPLYHNATGSIGFPLQQVTQGTRALLYVPHLSADQELATAGRTALVNSIVAAESSAPLFAVDPRGSGELKPHLAVGLGPENYCAQHQDMLGEPMLGRMVWDLLRCIDLLAAHGYDVHIAGQGFGAIPAALASLLHPAVVETTLNNALTRWHATARALPDQMAYPQSMLPMGVLLSFDLTDVYGELEELTSTNAWGAWGGLGGET